MLITRFIPSSIKKKLIGKIANHISVPDAKQPYQYNQFSEDIRKAEGKYILVTGATGAIGSAVCLKLASQGAVVGVCGRNTDKISSTIESIKAVYSSAKLEAVILEVTNEDQIKDAITCFAQKNNGRIDALVNNAGGGERNRKAVLDELPTKVITEVLDTNLLGSMLCAKYVLPYMKPFCSGKIVNLSSVMGMNGKETMCSYSASKAGIIGFTKALALECGEFNICVNSVAPGMVFQRQWDRNMDITRTSTNCLKRFGYTDEIANLIAFLISDEANYITGQNIAFDGGRSIGLK